MGIPQTIKQYDTIWMVMYGLTKFAHFIPVKSTYSLEDYASILIDEIMCLHCIPLLIISDRGTQLTSRFW